MPKLNAKKISCSLNVSKRYKYDKDNDEKADCNDHDFVNEMVDLNNSLTEVSFSEDENQNEKACQTEIVILDDKSTNTVSYDGKTRLSEIQKHFNLKNVSDLLCIFIDLFPNFTSIHMRTLSVFIFALLRILDIPYDRCKDVLNVLNLLSAQSCGEWILTMIDEDDLTSILRDKRGNHKKVGFYELFPDFEIEVKAYAIKRATEKKCDFDSKDLAKYVDNRFREIIKESNEEYGFDPNKLVRSEESCRADLLKWGAKFEKNKSRPYFEGHERTDVVEKRNQFVEYFSNNKDLYSYPFFFNDSTQKYEWNKPTRKARIILSHDETTIRSGEISESRWMFPGLMNFLFNKGRGRSIMISMFIVQHHSGDIFELNQKEWENALKKYPELNQKDDFLNFFPRSANAWIEPKKDNYFDNRVILQQFERFFKLMQFKEEFKGCEIEILVDNATTHSAKIYDVNMFNKRAGTNCIYKNIEWTDENGNQKRYTKYYISFKKLSSIFNL